MRRIPLLLILALCMAPVACKRKRPPRELPEDGRAAAPRMIPADPATRPATLPTTLPADATFSETQLMQFIALSREMIAASASVHRAIERSPEGFSALVDALNEDESGKQPPFVTREQLQQWETTGARAWSAWSVAQVDYNAEAPLRENARRQYEAGKQLSLAEATLKTGARVMSPEERARRIDAARDSVVNSRDRAEMWQEKSARLREQLAEPTDIAEASPGDGAAVLSQRNERLGAIRAARMAMAQELAAAEINEKQAREDANRAEAAAVQPELPLDDGERSELLANAREAIKRAKADIAACQQQADLLRLRLADDRRVASQARRKTASESDIAMLREHLAEFNDAWGMTVEGRMK